MKVIYRISEGGYPKEKPDYITKINCLKNALKHFKQDDFLLIMDGVSDNLKSEIEKVYTGKAQIVNILIRTGKITPETLNNTLTWDKTTIKVLLDTHEVTESTINKLFAYSKKIR